MLPFEDAEAAPYLDPYSEEERDESWHLFTPQGEHFTKGEATVVLLQHLPALAWVAKLVRVLRLEKAIGFLYWVVSKNRGRLSRFMSGAPGPRRFP